MTAITSTQLENAASDAVSLGSFVNDGSSPGTYTTRTSRVGKTLAYLESQVVAAVASVASVKNAYGRPVLETLATPPSSPSTGQRYLVAATGTSGDFVGSEDQVAEWDGSAWSFSGSPLQGQSLYVSGASYLYGSSWNASHVSLAASASLSDANTQAVALGVPLHIDCAVTLADDFSLTAYAKFVGGKIKPDGNTLTIGDFDAPDGVKIFDMSGSGSVVAATSSTRREADAFWFGVVGDNSTDNNSALSDALSYLASITTTVSTIALASTRLYFGKNGYFYDSGSQTWSCLAAELIVDLGEGVRSSIIRTAVNGPWFTFTGATTVGVLCRSYSGIRGGQIMGPKDDAKTAVRAVKFQDITNGFFKTDTGGFDYGADVELNNKFSFCENFRLGGIGNTNKPLLLSSTSPDSGTTAPASSYNNLRFDDYEFNGQDRLDPSDHVSALICFQQDGYTKKAYNIDGTVRFFIGTHGTGVAYVPSPGTGGTSTDFHSLTGKLNLKPDGLAGVYDGSASALFFTQKDDNGFGFIDLDLTGVQFGQGNPTDIAFDLTSETNPATSATPDWSALVDTRNSSNSTFANIVAGASPDVHLRGAVLRWTAQVKLGRTATFTWAPFLQAYSCYRLRIATVGDAQRIAEYQIQTRETDISTVVTLIGSGQLPTGWTVTTNGSVAGHPTFHFLIDNSAATALTYAVVELEML